MFVAHYHEMGGGAEYVLDELVRTISRKAQDVEIVVVAPDRGGVLDRMKTYGASVEVIPHPRWADFGPLSARDRLERGIQSMRATTRARDLIRSWSPTVVLTNTMTIPTFALAARSLKVPHVWMIQEFGKRDHGLSFSLGYRPTLRLIGALSTMVMCCSNSVRDELAASGVAVAKLQTIYYGVDTPSECDSPLARRSREPLRAVMVGRIAAAKGQMLAVQGVQRARAMGANVSLTLVGSEHEPRYAAQLRSLAGQEVRFVGQVEDATSEYCDAHVALTCSKDEAFGRVTVEAMKLGVPVIGTDSGGTREIVANEQNGYLIPRGDVSALAARLVELWADEGLRTRLAAQARADALRRFSPTGCMNEVLALCTSVGTAAG
jgi:glycosyltransferase involved in cell wall biosynthesis